MTCVSLLSGPRADLWPFYGFLCKRFSLYLKITNGKEHYRVLPRRNLEAIGAVGANLRPFSFGGSVEPLRLSAKPW